MDEGDRDPESLLPLTPAMFHILLALEGGELHGYGVRLEIEARTERQVKLGPGTLYGLIKTAACRRSDSRIGCAVRPRSRRRAAALLPSDVVRTASRER